MRWAPSPEASGGWAMVQYTCLGKTSTLGQHLAQGTFCGSPLAELWQTHLDMGSNSHPAAYQPRDFGQVLHLSELRLFICKKGP